MMTAFESESLQRKRRTQCRPGRRRCITGWKALPAEFALQTEADDFLINLRVRVELIQFDPKLTVFRRRRTFSHGVLSMRSSIVNPSSGLAYKIDHHLNDTVDDTRSGTITFAPVALRRNSGRRLVNQAGSVRQQTHVPYAYLPVYDREAKQKGYTAW